MGDGYLGKCKTCTKSDTAERESRLMSDPVTCEKEHERHRMKSRRYRESGRVIPVSLETQRDTLRKARSKNPLANRARAKLLRAVKLGLISRMPCSVCGGVDSEGHHEDHSKPLEVIWLCKKHHAEADNKLRRDRRTAKLESTKGQ